MFKRLRKLSPMVRSVGVIGATAALVTGVTFANLTSNTVALSPNAVTVAGAQLKIGSTGCGDASTADKPGFNVTNFSVSNPASVNFCLQNSGSVPLAITGTVSDPATTALNASAEAQATTLTIQCGSDPAISGTLSTSWATTFPTVLPSTGAENCTATLTLSPTYTGSGNVAIPSFKINFVGTEPTPV